MKTFKTTTGRELRLINCRLEEIAKAPLFGSGGLLTTTSENVRNKMQLKKSNLTVVKNNENEPWAVTNDEAKRISLSGILGEKFRFQETDLDSATEMYVKQVEFIDENYDIEFNLLEDEFEDKINAAESEFETNLDNIESTYELRTYGLEFNYGLKTDEITEIYYNELIDHNKYDLLIKHLDEDYKDQSKNLLTNYEMNKKMAMEIYKNVIQRLRVDYYNRLNELEEERDGALEDVGKILEKTLNKE